MTVQPISIRDATPLETGGTDARKGFSFQDHVAVGFLLDLIEDADLQEVWCESQDDVTLLWDGAEKYVEFVQVKAIELNQLWSIAELTKKKKEQTKTGHDRKPSILERSLDYDRYIESSRFRMVTTLRPNDDLKALENPLKSEQRKRHAVAISELKTRLKTKLPKLTSKNGNSTDYWVDHAIWDTRHDANYVQQANLLRLKRIVEATGEFLASDQVGELYAKLLATAKSAAEADWGDRGERRKFTKATFIKRFDEILVSVAHPSQANPAGTNLTRKLTEAKLLHEVETAASLRRRYREAVLSPKYMSNPDRSIVEGEIEAALHRLRSGLDMGSLPDDGPEFHSTCLNAIARVRLELENSSHVKDIPPDSWMIGFMYNLADRCPHRFRRAST
jgi:hypothetical protein